MVKVIVTGNSCNSDIMIWSILQQEFKSNHIYYDTYDLCVNERVTNVTNVENYVSIEDYHINRTCNVFSLTSLAKSRLYIKSFPLYLCILRQLFVH